MFNLITGHQGLPHITAEQVSTLNDIFMYGYGADTIVRLQDGTIGQDGRAIVVAAGYWRANGYDMQITEDETIAFDPTEAGVSRIDVVYAEILQDIPTGNQRTEFVVIQGIPDVTPSEPPVPTGPQLTTDELILALPVAKCTITQNTMTFVDETIPLNGGNVEEINEQLEAIRNFYGAKNLFETDLSSFVESGLTFTVNDDGTVLVTGTSTDNGWFNLSPWVTIPNKIPAGTELFCQVSDNTSILSMARLYVRNAANDTESFDIPTGGMSFTPQIDVEKLTLQFFIGLNQYMGPSGLILKPMLCLASMNDGIWTPFTKTNKTLTEETDSLRADLGKPTDTASVTGTAFQMISYNRERIGNIGGRLGTVESNLGSTSAAADPTGSAFARIASLKNTLDKVGLLYNDIVTNQQIYNTNTHLNTLYLLPGVYILCLTIDYNKNLKNTSPHARRLAYLGTYNGTTTYMIDSFNSNWMPARGLCIMRVDQPTDLYVWARTQDLNESYDTCASSVLTAVRIV